MEEPNFENITLKEAGLNISWGRIYQTFRNHGITNVSQILNDELMSDIIKRAMPDTRITLQALISLIKYKYLGIPIPDTSFLDMPMKDTKFGPLVIGINSNQGNKLSRLIEFGKKRGIINDDMPLIEALKLLYSNPLLIEESQKYDKSKLASLPFTAIELYIRSYDESKRTLPITTLKKQLMDLMETRNKLDSQIAELQNIIANLEAEEKRGK